jgi:hypothetical protein
MNISHCHPASVEQSVSNPEACVSNSCSPVCDMSQLQNNNVRAGIPPSKNYYSLQQTHVLPN